MNVVELEPLLAATDKAKDNYDNINGLKESSLRKRKRPTTCLKGRELVIVNPTNIGLVSTATLRKLQRDGVERMWTFPNA